MTRREARVRAPQLRGRGWLNTGGKELGLADLRGKIVLLDFWTFCCINCLHVLDELRPLEEKYADVLAVIGVHSPKFEHEKDPEALAAATERYGVAHPVLDDPELVTWQNYAARAWPTLAVVDPEGYLVASMAGEGHAEGLDRLLAELVAEHEEKGTLHRGTGPYVAPPAPETALRFPGKVIELPASRTGREAATLLVSDSASHSLVELAADGETVLRRIGSGQRGRLDAPVQFNEPQGLCLLPEHEAGIAGFDVVVADTVNHLLRGVRLADGAVTTIAGTGRQWRGTLDYHAHDARSADLSSPWDVAWYEGKVVIAMAGTHTLWWYDPVKRTAGCYAGTTVEALRDGALDQAWFAQPSGLSVSPDGRRLWLADSETSALRYIEGGVLHTAVGQGLFDFGHVDGPAAEALFQHPLGVAALPDGTVAVADTYNGAVRQYDPVSGTVRTLAVDLAEPSDVLLLGDELVVVESAAHRLVRPLVGGLEVSGSRLRVERPVTELAPGEVELRIVFEPAPGQKLDETYGPSTRLDVSASPTELLLEGSGVTTDLTRRLVLAEGTGVLQVVAQAATCDAEAENPACHLTRQDWGVPISVAPGGATTLTLVLRGLD
ncbi:NHL domain-containing thioredoxin family protein [Longispora albida]|uniref:NHL domain-containing thioredoxin family protein n=1 Tax=Longispora albida TaxID=203523 RepID=UPI00036B12C9|nr:NHL domain-containing thioredoxin family protein [Longispora albida]